LYKKLFSDGLPVDAVLSTARVPAERLRLLAQGTGPLADSISDRVAGETKAWRIGGDVVVITLANSPPCLQAPDQPEAVAIGLAPQAIDCCESPIGSIAVTLHEKEIFDHLGTAREYLFPVRDGRPELFTDLGLQYGAARFRRAVIRPSCQAIAPCPSGSLDYATERRIEFPTISRRHRCTGT
jgi:transposase InsO family protein